MKNNYLIQSGNDIYRAIKTLKITQFKLAQLIGSTPATISRLIKQTSIRPIYALAIECLLRRQAEHLKGD